VKRKSYFVQQTDSL